MNFPLSGKIYAIEAKDSTSTVLNITTEKVEEFLHLEELFTKWKDAQPGRRVNYAWFNPDQLGAYQNLIGEFRTSVAR